MKVIAGLGNPGAEYANTPHSIGFEVVDAFVRSSGLTWKASASFKGEIASGVVEGVKVVLVKPTTYMNLSGECVAPVLKYHNATVADLIVVSDDIDLPMGKIRVRPNGSAGGHNGIKSVISHVGTQEFVRVRVGVGRDEHNRGNVIGHVLGKFSADARKVMDEVVEEAVHVVETLENNSVEIAMNRYNAWVAPSAQQLAGKENVQ